MDEATSSGPVKSLLVLTLLLLLGPLIVRGHVIFPHDNGVEVGMGGEPEGKWNRKFNDQSSVYVPAIHQHLNGDHTGWISTWNPHPELGRPTFQLAGESKAFFLTHVLSWFTKDAFRLYTWQTILAIVASVVFGYLLLRELGLGAAPSMVGALGFGCGFFPMYWMTFMLFIWGIAWSLAIFWLVEIQLKRPSAWCILGLAVSIQSLLLTAYPQTVIWHVYLGLLFLVWRLRVHRGKDPEKRWQLRGLAGLVAGAVLGALAAAPVYLDLAENAGRSVRLDADPEFFLQVLPSIESFADACTYLLQRFDGSWFGDPILHDYPTKFNGLSATPLFFGLAFLSLLFLRRMWALHAFCLVCVVMTLWPPAYAFGIEYLGLHVSRTIPLAAAYLPGIFLAAYAADRWIRAERRPMGAALGVWSVLTLLLAAAGFGSELELEWSFVLASIGLWLGATAFLVTGKPAVIVVVALLGCLHYGWRLQLTRPRDEIQTSSPLTEVLARETDGARYALIESGFGVTLPSNQESVLGLHSIHTYNSISSKSYQELAASLSPRGTETYGRHFTHIAAPELLDPVRLARAGVNVLVTSRDLPREWAQPISRNPKGGGIWRTRLPAIRERVLPQSGYARTTEGIAPSRAFGSKARTAELPVDRTLDRDDELAFSMPASQEETLLFVSQQFHPKWHAQSGGVELETAEVDGFYLGVVLPPGTGEVELSFRPLVRHAWIPQALGLGCALLLALRSLLRRRSATS